MTVKEKALSLIGLERTRNIDVLLDDLAELTAEELLCILPLDSPLVKRLKMRRCDDCWTKHGTCPHPFSQDCPGSLAEWLEQPTDRETIIGDLLGEVEA